VSAVTAIESIVVVPGDARVTEVSDRGAVPVPIRTARRLDELAEALGRRLGVPASVSEGAAPAPGDGTLVVCRPDVLHGLAQVGSPGLSWVVAVDLDRTSVLERAESLGLAAAVEVRDYLDWLTSASRPPAIVGRKELAPRIAATIDARPLQSSRRYARMTRPEGDLPTLLADYLAAYAEAGLAAA
jgi:hypothetical protein